MSFQTFQQDLGVGVECLHELGQDFNVERWDDGLAVPVPCRTCSEMYCFVTPCLLLRLLRVTFGQNYTKYSWLPMWAQKSSLFSTSWFSHLSRGSRARICTPLVPKLFVGYVLDPVPYTFETQRRYSKSHFNIILTSLPPFIQLSALQHISLQNSACMVCVSS